MAYSAHAHGLCCSGQDIGFKKHELGEVVDVEAVLDIEKMDVGIKLQRHMNTGSMVWEIYELEIKDEHFP